LIAPHDVERDDAGNTYVMDPFTASVRKYDAANNFVLDIGTTAGAGQLGFPTAIGVNEVTGELYAANLSSFSPSATVSIKRYDAAGNFVGEFGGSGAAEGQFGFVSGISVHRVSGDVYIVEGHRVQRFSAAGQFELMWGKDVDPAGGSGAETCAAGCKQAEQGGAEGEFSSPTDIAAVGASVFVSEDTNKRIQRFNGVTGDFEIMGGRDVDPGGSQGAETCIANCQAGTGGTGPGELDEPRGLDVNVALGFLYVVDQRNHRVQRWTAALTYLGEFGAEGTGDGQFTSPDGLTENAGIVVVTDAGQFSVQRFTGLGAFQARIGTPSASTLVIPEGLTVGGGGVYVTDARDRVARFDPTGAFLNAWGGEGSAQGQFRMPTGISTDPVGNVYVADSGNDRIQRFDPAGVALGAFGSTGSATGEFDDPVDLAVGPGGNVFTLESGTNNRVQKFSPIGAFLGTWGAAGSANGQFGGAAGIATDAAGNIYVADTGNDRIQKFDSEGNRITAWGSTGMGNGEFNAPTDVAVDSLGNVYVADRGNNRVQRFDSGGTFLGKWGANGGDGTAGRGPGEFSSPTSIAVDAQRDIYVLDFLNGRVQKFAAAAPPPTPLAAPNLSVYGNKRQSAKRLRVIVTCGGPPCQLRIAGKIVVGTAGRARRGDSRSPQGRSRGISLKLKPVTVGLNPGATRTVKLTLRKRRSGLRKITGALSRGARGAAIVRAVATNAAGSDKAKRRLRLK
jgi:sugar lactone lactonase YvrE